MYLVTETVGQTKVETPVATAYDGFLHLAQTVPTYRYNQVEGAVRPFNKRLSFGSWLSIKSLRHYV